MKALALLALVAATCTPTAVSIPPDADAARPPSPPGASDGHFCTPGCDCACDVLQAQHCAAGGILHGATCYQRCELDRGTPAAMPVACVSVATSADAIRGCGVLCL